LERRSGASIWAATIGLAATVLAAVIANWNTLKVAWDDDQTRSEISLVMGVWDISKWAEAAPYGETTGYLTIDKSGAALLTIINSESGRITQTGSFRPIGGKYVFDGDVVEGEDWSNDRLVLTLDGNALTGSGHGSTGESVEVEFVRK